MAEPVSFPGANFTFKAPDGRDDIGDLAVFRQPNGNANVSCWHLSPEELEEVTRTGLVYLSVLSGRIFFPAYVGTENTVRAITADTGAVWNREG